MTAAPFALDPRLAADTLPIGRLALSRILLMNDCTYPWLILVPERPGIRELYDLPAADRAVLIEEIAACARALTDALAQARVPDKLNVAALGNVVAQLHVHVVARFADDPAWPAPVWGRAPVRPYAPVAAEALAGAVTARLPGLVRR
jgi:diadenosine tetraphosphate (Ap4A) HIT family hydrolase